MVLGSQAPRAASSRQYMVSSRRRKGRRMQLVIAGLVLLGMIVAYFFWPSGDAAVAAPGAPPGQAEAPEDPRPAPAQGHQPPDHPSITLRQPPESMAPRPLVDLKPQAPARDTPPARSAAGQRPPLPPTHALASPQAIDSRVQQGMDLISDGHLVAGRAVLSELLFADPPVLGARDADTVRTTLQSVNQELVFSGDAIANDPLAEYYTVRRRDTLGKIAPHFKVPYAFIEMINDTPSTRLRVDQKIKLIKGPFHARVSKRDYRMDLFLRGDDGLPVYVMSVPVGLGEDDSTPNGLWQIKRGSKVKNPDWKNPRTGEYFHRDHPENPIGEYWMALEGKDEQTAGVKGYGIHGTTEQDSIGDQRSMGCIRLRDQDIELMFKMLAGGESTVEIVP